MTGYGGVLRSLGFSEALSRCAEGSLALPLITYQSPAEWYLHPPALIPVASDGSGPWYLGLWKHWFSERAPSFVKMSVEDDRLVQEVALSEQPFFSYLALLAVVAEDGRTAEIEAFAEAVGGLDLAAIDSVSLETGDAAAGLGKLSRDAEGPPAISAPPGGYKGSFPTAGADLQTACGFELPVKQRGALRSDLKAPLWLRRTEQPEAFDRLLTAGDLQGAWLSLNSPGWTLGAAVDAIEQLRRSTSDEGFQILSEVWCALAKADSSHGRY